MDDQNCRAGAFYPDYTVASTSSIYRAVSMGGDYRGLLGKVCRCAQGKCGTLKDTTDLAVSHLFLDCAREMDTRAHSGVFVDIKPDVDTIDGIAESALKTAKCLMFV